MSSFRASNSLSLFETSSSPFRSFDFIRCWACESADPLRESSSSFVRASS